MAIGMPGPTFRIAKQMGHRDFTMLVKVYAAWMEDESPNELQHIWEGLKKAH